MYQGPAPPMFALESSGNLERAYQTLAFSQNMLLREILIELRVMSHLLQDGLNTADEPEELRTDAQADLLIPYGLEG